VQERLPEVRFDLMPSTLVTGLYERGSAAPPCLSRCLRTDPKLRTTRYDAYYGLEYPINPTPWFNFTPVAGGRVTHYTNAIGGKDDYTRTLGEIGFDAHLLASGTFDYKNPVWEIDGLRHLVEPKLSYRYAPEAANGRLHPADRPARVLDLPAASIHRRLRNIDDLDARSTPCAPAHNTLQTRDASYGRATSHRWTSHRHYRFDRTAGQHALSDIYKEFALTPAPGSSGRFSIATTRTRRNCRIQHRARDHRPKVVDRPFRHPLPQGQLENIIWNTAAPERSHRCAPSGATTPATGRFNEQITALQRLGQTSVKYEVSWFNGPRRESSFAMTSRSSLT